jgi:hypothetical protein
MDPELKKIKKQRRARASQDSFVNKYGLSKGVAIC